MNSVFTYIKHRILGDLIWHRGDANVYLLGIVRIMFSLAGIGLVLSTIPLIDMIWFPTVVDHYTLILLFHLGWLASLIWLLSGRGGHWPAIIHYIFAWIGLNFENSGDTMEDNIYLVLSFWMMWLKAGQAYQIKFKKGFPFIRFEHNVTREVPGWPLILMGVNFGLVFFFGGLSKWLDPLWHSGDGAYFAFHLNWIKPAWLNWMLDLDWLLTFMNWSVIITELFFLVFFLFKKTRPIAIFALLFFFVTLTFPMRVDYIGPLGFTLGLGLVCIDKRAQNILFTIFGWLRLKAGDKLRSFKEKPISERVESARGIRWLRRVLLTSWALLTIHLVCIDDVVYPHVLYPMQYTSDDPKFDPHETSWLHDKYKHVRWSTPVGPALDWFNKEINLRIFKIKRIHVFNSVHTVGQLGFRVFIHYEDGTKDEPWALFSPENTGTTMTTFLAPRWVQARMYFFRDVWLKAVVNDPYEMPDWERVGFDGVMYYTLGFADENKTVKEIEIIMAHCNTPHKNIGSEIVYNPPEWFHFVTYDVATENVEFTVPEQFPQTRVQVDDKYRGTIQYDTDILRVKDDK